MLLAEQKGAAAIIIVLGIPGNFTTQLWGSGGEGPDLTKVPWFSVGNDDGTALREMIDRGASREGQDAPGDRNAHQPEAVRGVRRAPGYDRREHPRHRPHRRLLGGLGRQRLRRRGDAGARRIFLEDPEGAAAADDHVHGADRPSRHAGSQPAEAARQPRHRLRQDGADHQRRARDDDADVSVSRRSCGSRTRRRRIGSSSAAAAGWRRSSSTTSGCSASRSTSCRRRASASPAISSSWSTMRRGSRSSNRTPSTIPTRTSRRSSRRPGSSRSPGPTRRSSTTSTSWISRTSSTLRRRQPR